MTDPLPTIPHGRADQAARFVDLARQHLIEPEQPAESTPLIAARLQDAIAPETQSTPATFTLDDDGDVFGDPRGAPSGPTDPRGTRN